VELHGQTVELTGKEFELLLHFARAPGRVFARAQLLDQVWGYSHLGYDHTVSSHINRLRNKIERDPANPEFVQTVWGVGYKFAERKGWARPAPARPGRASHWPARFTSPR
jgi:DNA-binding response OmpR family regulator